MKTKILILTLLVLLTSNAAFGQTRRRSNSKARTTTTVSRPSAAILKAYTALFENYYFFNYDGGDKNLMLFNKPNAQGQGKFFFTTESLDVAFAGSYTIKANGKVYINCARVKGSLTLHDEPLGFFDNYGVFIQADDNAQVYEEILSKRVMN